LNDHTFKASSSNKKKHVQNKNHTPISQNLQKIHVLAAIARCVGNDRLGRAAEAAAATAACTARTGLEAAQRPAFAHNERVCRFSFRHEIGQIGVPKYIKIV
jgi:hypothetical protein